MTKNFAILLIIVTASLVVIVATLYAQKRDYEKCVAFVQAELGGSPSQAAQVCR